MPRTITLSDLKIDAWTVNTEQRSVTVAYRLLEAGGRTYASGQAVLWAQMPAPAKGPNGDDLPLPDHWHLLPAAYRAVLVDLTRDLRAGLLKLLD